MGYWRAAADPNPRPLRDLIQMDVRQQAAATAITERPPRAPALDEPVITEYGAWVETPSLCAIRHHNVGNVRLLLEAGASPDGVAVVDMLRYTIRMLDSFRVVGDGGSMVIDTDEKELCALLRTSLSQESDVFRELQERRDASVAVPFWNCANNLHVQVVLDADSTGTPSPDTGNSPVPSLIVAAWHNLHEVVDLLLQYGADASSWTNDQGQDILLRNSTSSALSSVTPLHAAAHRGHAGMVEQLLSLGFSPNITTTKCFADATTVLQYSLVTKTFTAPLASICFVQILAQISPFEHHVWMCLFSILLWLRSTRTWSTDLAKS
ncbi:hypothetical protein DOTSEDRAFT_26433 [Dothistroma septosporum NZE10]|uniref:Uncharacterized protein n=1 Tax=Dothistroma septosporum (strain NZE10 / CBS 128990) TaxID=675120 RepID=N1PF61_DOTSN|nr:hypothetical protein DOTSEDRAFT_26433 [Dothistroma septosporum NZE10]